MIDGGEADEPDGRSEDLALDHQVHVEQLVQVEQEAGQVRDEEHAYDANQDHGKLKIFGLLKETDRNKVNFVECLEKVCQSSTKSTNAIT